MIAAISNAKTIAKPALLPICKISSTGSNCRMPNAPLEISTLMKFQAPDHITAMLGVSEWV